MRGGRRACTLPALAPRRCQVLTQRTLPPGTSCAQPARPSGPCGAPHSSSRTQSSCTAPPRALRRRSSPWLPPRRGQNPSGRGHSRAAAECKTRWALSPGHLRCSGEESDRGDAHAGRHRLQLLGRPRGLHVLPHHPDGPRDPQHGARSEKQRAGRSPEGRSRLLFSDECSGSGTCVLNYTTISQRTQQARFLKMAVDFKRSIGFNGTLLIEPKPKARGGPCRSLEARTH